MPERVHDIVYSFAQQLKLIYGESLKKIVVYGSYARGDYNKDSDIDIMILLDVSDMEIKEYRHQLSYMTYDFNEEYELDIKPIAKSEEHFTKWVDNYPFYYNARKEGVNLYGAA